MEEVSKKPRGRPRRFSAEDMQRLARAQGLIEPVLSTYPELHWLLDPEALRRRKPHVYRRTIVEELGRIEDDNRLLSVARQLCELKPRTSAAVAIIRKFRGVQKPPDLVEALRCARHTYLRQHTELTLTDARDAVAALSEMMASQVESQQPLAIGSDGAICTTPRHSVLPRARSDLP